MYYRIMEPSHLLKNFKQVSGIEISKGEPGVVKALHKLWQKLQLLEQTHHIENAHVTKRKNEYNLAELQQKLLELQLQYMRTILRQNNEIDTTPVSLTKIATKDGIQLSSLLHDYSDHIPVRDCYDKHTQTDSASTKFTNSLYSEDEPSPVHCAKNLDSGNPIKEKMEFMLPNFRELEVVNGLTMRSPNEGIKKKNLRSHYHLKLSDVPFIIGTSTTSHSVVANVQKIISMMKVHNKGLCSSVPNLTRRSHSADYKKCNAQLGYHRAYSNPDLSGHWDLRNILHCLTDELKTLTSKLENMKKLSENPHSCKLSDNLQKEYINTLHLIEMKTKQIAALNKAIRKQTPQAVSFRQCRAFSASSPLSPSAEKINSASKDGSFVNRISKTEVKQVICSFSDASCKVDCSGRRKMMQELKEFQVHLQHEDIHWK